VDKLLVLIMSSRDAIDAEELFHSNLIDDASQRTMDQVKFIHKAAMELPVLLRERATPGKTPLILEAHFNPGKSKFPMVNHH
jgi:hypothetical protein